MSDERLRGLLCTGALLRLPLHGLALLALDEGEPLTAMRAFQKHSKDLDRQLAFCAELVALRPQDPELRQCLRELGFMPWDVLLHGTGEDETTRFSLKAFGFNPFNVFLSKRLVTLRNLAPGAPRSIHVNKSLIVSKTSVEQWQPRKLQVKGSLHFSDCEGALAVEGLCVGGRFQACPDITVDADQFRAGDVLRRFPDGFEVFFTPRTDIRGWRQNEFDPSIFDLKGKVGYGGFKAPEVIPDLPRGRVTSFDGSALPDSVTRLPLGEWQDQCLRFLDWKKVESISEGWAWPVGLELINFPELLELPNGLQFPEGLTLYLCEALPNLPKGLRVGRLLYLRELPNLRLLPDDLLLGGDLEIRWVDLDALPNNLQVPGNLLISDSRNLTKLPRGLTVGGDLTLVALPSLFEIPEDIKIGGSLKIYNCPRLGRGASR